MEKISTFKFGNIQERDMDLLFMESIATDREFVRLFLDKAAEKYDSFDVLSVALSETEPGLGESDITAVLSVDGRKIGLLLEDKIDAPATPEQADRYRKRAKRAIKEGKYEYPLIFIICPAEYDNKNEEAKNYPFCLTYEECKNYFERNGDIKGQLKSQQLNQAINAAKVKNWTKDPDAMAFFKKYRAYMEENHSTLDLRNSQDSNGWWPHYGTEFGNVYMYHKVSDGVVDLTFPGGAEKISAFEQIATWLRAHNMEEVRAVKTGKAAALRISVPVLDQHKPFEDANMDDVETCFKAIQQLSDFALILARAKSFIK